LPNYYSYSLCSSCLDEAFQVALLNVDADAEPVLGSIVVPRDGGTFIVGDYGASGIDYPIVPKGGKKRGRRKIRKVR